VLRARSIALAERARPRLAAAIAHYFQTVECGADPAAVDAAQARLLGTLADVLCDPREGAIVRGREIAASRMADLEAWIEANLETSISIGRLCKVAGVGERALQKSFESRRGMSPMRFVTERRLAEARRLLTQVGGRDDVTSIALGMGFNHTGRFAALYRQAFGESPSQSLRRSRRQPLAPGSA
jgi:transcriptional regulator GlxA family with amidase domain